MSRRAIASRRGRSRKSATPLVKAASRTVRILTSLLYFPRGKTLAELSAELGLHKTTTLRLLRTLATEKMVQQHADAWRFRFDPALWVRAAPIFSQMFSLSSMIQMILNELAQSTGATAVLGFPDNTGRNSIASMWALLNQPLRYDPSASISWPMHAAAGGKCFLAGLPEAELQEWIKGGLPRVAPRTTTSARQLMRELVAVRKLGYAVSQEEGGRGVSTIGVPLTDDSGAVVGCVVLATPAARLFKGDIKRWLPRLRSASKTLSRLLYSSAEPAIAEA